MIIRSINGVSVDAARPTPAQPATTPFVPKPGDILAVAIRRITGAMPCGACIERKAEMNRRGWWGCWKTRKEIAGWLAEECARRGHVIGDHIAIGLLRAAFRELWSKK